MPGESSMALSAKRFVKWASASPRSSQLIYRAVALVLVQHAIAADLRRRARAMTSALLAVTIGKSIGESANREGLTRRCSRPASSESAA